MLIACIWRESPIAWHQRQCPAVSHILNARSNMSVFAKVSTSRSRTRKTVIGGIAAIGAAALVLTGCAPTESDNGNTGGEERDLTLKIGTLLPQTGGLAFLGPPEEAGVALAAKEINEANLGIQVEIVYGDSGDPDNKAYATTVPNCFAQVFSPTVGPPHPVARNLGFAQLPARGSGPSPR